MRTETGVRPKPALQPLPAASVPSRLLQRSCACGGTPGASGECAECHKKRLGVQRKAAGVGGAGIAPPIVHEVLRSSGQPLDKRVRGLLEPRFGHDFSQVRVHTDSQAAESAGAVGAAAYTVGQNVVFGAGQYDPKSSAGRRLLAHELVHVVQQGKSYAPSSFQLSRANGANAGELSIGQPGDRFEREADRVAEQVMRMQYFPPWSLAEPTGAIAVGSPQDVSRKIQEYGVDQLLQRFVACESQEECPRRVSGEAGRAERDPMLIRHISSPVTGLVVGNFAIGSSSTKPNLYGNPIWSNFLAQMAANTNMSWEILGFTDCRGDESLNRTLRHSRAEALRGAMPRQHRAQLDQVSAASLADCLSDDTSEEGRALNRSALVRLSREEITFEEDELEEDEIVTARFCGPDVTDWLIDQMDRNQDHPVIRAGREHRLPRWVPVFNIGWTGAAFLDFALLVGPGMPWDFKRTQTGWRAGSGGPCPTRNCDLTVTLCGHCVFYDVPGNIHFGWVGRRMEIAPWALHLGAGSVQEGNARGDDPPDAVAIDIGIAMADEGRDLCSEVTTRLGQLNLDRTRGCSVCAA